MSDRRELTNPNGYRISYLATGSGPALIMIPGILHSAESWESAGYLDHFASTNRVIAIDPVGHGLSDAPNDPDAYTPEAVVEDVIAVLEHEAASSVCIWGYSLGAHTALLVARRRPGLIDGVVAGSVFLGDRDAGLRSMGMGLEETVEAAVDALDRGDWATFFDMHLDDVGEELRDRHIADSSPAVLAVLARSHLLWPRRFLKPSVPALVYWFADEVFAAQNQRAVEMIPVEWAVVPGSYHDGFARVEEIAPVVERFLDSLDRS